MLVSAHAADQGQVFKEPVHDKGVVVNPVIDYFFPPALEGQKNRNFGLARRALEAENKAFRATSRQDLINLNQRLTESERQLRRLSGLYEDLERLIAVIERELKNGG